MSATESEAELIERLRAERPRALDLFCGAGGVSVGLARAGFDVSGVDLNPKLEKAWRLGMERHAPEGCVGEFHAADALTFSLEGYDFVWASPPCQAYSIVTRIGGKQGSHADLIPAMRRRMTLWQVTPPSTFSPPLWCMENVPGAPLHSPVVLCGASFGLGAQCEDGEYRPLKRHRLIESSWQLEPLPCSCDRSLKISVHGGSHRRVQALGVYGHGGQDRRSRGRRGGYQGSAAESRLALGIDWMGRDQLAQAIPPAYAEWIGKQAMRALGRP